MNNIFTYLHFLEQTKHKKQKINTVKKNNPNSNLSGLNVLTLNSLKFNIPLIVYACILHII